MRIPLPIPAYQALMNGMTLGSNMAHAAAQNAALAAQTSNMQRLLALKQQLQPAQINEMNAAAQASQASTSLTPAKLKMYLAQSAALSSGAANKTQLTQAQVNNYNRQNQIALATFRMRQAIAQHYMGGGKPPSPSASVPGTISTPSAGGTSGGVPFAPSPSQSGAMNLPSTQPTVPSTTQSVGTPSALPGAIVTEASGAPSPGMQIAGSVFGMHLPNAQQLETPAEKASLAVQTATGTAQLNAAYKSIPALQQTIASLKTMKNITNGPEGHGFTKGGIFYPMSADAKYLSNDPNRTAFIASGANVVANLDRAFSMRGGAYALRAAKGFKPSVNMPAGANAGMITELGSHVQSELRQAIRTVQQYGGNLHQFGDLTPSLDPSLPVNTYGLQTKTLPTTGITYYKKGSQWFPMQ
jgi:hypothetical protein